MPLSTPASPAATPVFVPPFALDDPASYHSWVDEHVRFNDLDPVGHANNNAIGVYFESGRLGLSADMPPGIDLSGMAIVLRQITIDYRAEITFPNRLRVGSRVARVGRTSWVTAAGIFINGRCHATSTCVNVLIDRTLRTSTPVPDALRGALLANMDAQSGAQS